MPATFCGFRATKIPVCLPGGSSSSLSKTLSSNMPQSSLQTHLHVRLSFRRLTSHGHHRKRARCGNLSPQRRTNYDHQAKRRLRLLFRPLTPSLFCRRDCRRSYTCPCAKLQSDQTLCWNQCLEDNETTSSVPLQETPFGGTLSTQRRKTVCSMKAAYNTTTRILLGLIVPSISQHSSTTSRKSPEHATDSQLASRSYKFCD